uniref:Uncharacterized protein n=1 Tax=Anguilla anguilla TaxID=7936 RepID=A0A0E9TPT5_ANGAN
MLGGSTTSYFNSIGAMARDIITVEIQGRKSNYGAHLCNMQSTVVSESRPVGYDL